MVMAALRRIERHVQALSHWARLHALATWQMREPTPEELLHVLSPAGCDAIAERLTALKRVDLTPSFAGHAAVLVPLCIDRQGQPAVLFTKRSSALRSHRGEVSFPGGRVDADDADAVAAALRECQEEVHLSPLRVLGLWHDVTNKDLTAAVTPCIAFLGPVNPSTQPFNADEVEEVFTISLARLMDPKLRSSWTPSRAPGIRMPQFDGGPHRVWGLTAYILSGVLNTVVFPSARQHKSNL